MLYSITAMSQYSTILEYIIAWGIDSTYKIDSRDIGEGFRVISYEGVYVTHDIIFDTDSDVIIHATAAALWNGYMDENPFKKHIPTGGALSAGTYIGEAKDNPVIVYMVQARAIRHGDNVIVYYSQSTNL